MVLLKKYSSLSIYDWNTYHQYMFLNLLISTSIDSMSHIFLLYYYSINFIFIESIKELKWMIRYRVGWVRWGRHSTFRLSPVFPYKKCHCLINVPRKSNKIRNLRKIRRKYKHLPEKCIADEMLFYKSVIAAKESFAERHRILKSYMHSQMVTFSANIITIIQSKENSIMTLVK